MIIDEVCKILASAPSEQGSSVTDILRIPSYAMQDAFAQAGLAQPSCMA